MTKRLQTRQKGLSFAEAFVEQGVAFPAAATAEPEAPKDKRTDFPARPRKHGTMREGYGWQAVAEPRGRVYRATTDQVGGVFPFLTASPLPKSGATLGYVASNGTGFYVDPWQWVQQGLVTNPNLLSQGAPGRGKSGTGKALVRRMLRHGGRAFIPGDLKNEWADLCREWGQEPWEVGPGMHARINPLDPGPLAAGWDGLNQSQRDERWVDIRARWLTLLEGLIGAQDVNVNTMIQEALAAVVDELTGADAEGGNVHTVPDIIIPEVWHLAHNPTPQLLRRLKYENERDYFDKVRPMTSALSVLVNGSLKGMFDARTTVDVDWDARIHSLSMRRLKELANDQVIGVALTCANSWVTAMTSVNTTGQVTIIPRDEVWRVMSLGVNAIKSLDFEPAPVARREADPDAHHAQARRPHRRRVRRAARKPRSRVTSGPCVTRRSASATPPRSRTKPLSSGGCRARRKRRSPTGATASGAVLCGESAITPSVCRRS
ncbi:hypothetical protein ACX31A_15045 [Dermacoccus nishinomiyaensis]